jgi:hypothetical protein
MTRRTRARGPRGDRLLAVLVCGVVLAPVIGCESPPLGNRPRFWVGRNDPIVPPPTGAGGSMPQPVRDGGEPEPDPDPDPPPPGPSTDARPVSPTDGPAGNTPPSAGCSLAVQVTTVTTNQDYRPRNVGAIWIQDAAGKYVKTLAAWGARRISNLGKWSSITSAAGVPRDKTDAITGATASNHGVRRGNWNCTDYMRAPTPNGAYRMCFEMTESNGSSNSEMSCVNFTKGATPFTVSPPNEQYFINRTMTFTP